MIKIATDGSVDMPEGWAEKFSINIIPLTVRFGEDAYLPGVNMNGSLFYRLVKERRIFPKTSLPSPEELIHFYRKIAKKGEEIISLHITQKMSGTFDVVQMAAKELAGEINIHPFDSGAGSAALGFMCRETRWLDEAGYQVQDILNKLEAIKRRLTLIFTVDNLEFARLSGRINALQGLLSSMLKIKPIIILKDGLLQIGDKVRTRKNSLDKILQSVKDRVGDEAVRVAIVHAEDLATAKSLVERARELLNIKELIITELSIPVAANLGPGTVGIVAYPLEGGNA